MNDPQPLLAPGQTCDDAASNSHDHPPSANRARTGGDPPTPPIPSSSGIMPPLAALRCCCGQTECVFLKHNCSVLESVEKDVRTAARLGQSLLQRHEAYMADAERDRAELVNRIGQLEMDKKELEAENARKIEENRALLDQLESLNTTVADSDTRIHVLEATLQSSQQIIRRLEGASERAEDMERHLAALEAEQAILQSNLVTSEAEARTALQRWRRAERGIADLQFQLERMEKETREDRERHMEIVGRMERQRAVEKELNTAAGRLKGAAAAKTLQDSSKSGAVGAGSGVVSHFVRDLLKDNANLQLGIAELRDMLMNSNDEIQSLRDQLMFHQPIPEVDVSAASTLRAELGTEVLEAAEVPEGQEGGQALVQASTQPDQLQTQTIMPTPATPRASRHRPSLSSVSSTSQMSQELHIHHHFHMGNKKAEIKRTKKKRLSLTPSVFTPPATIPSTPLSRAASLQYQELSSSLPGAGSPSQVLPNRRRHLSRDSTSSMVPSNRYSVFSDQPSDFMSSVPSSPQTNPRNSIFDRSAISDFSLPTSPTSSFAPTSPPWQSANQYASMTGACDLSSPPPLNLSAPAEPAQAPLPIIEVDETATTATAAPSPGSSPPEAAEGSRRRALPPLALSSISSVSEAPTPTPAEDVSFDVGVDNDEMAETTGPAEPAEDTAMPPYMGAGSRRRLRRAVSHESIVSLHGGLDIHTLKSRPSQLLMLQPVGSALADIGVSSVTARPVMSKAGPEVLKSSSLLRDRLAGGGLMPPTKPRIVSSPLASTAASNAQAAGTLSSATSTSNPGGRFGKLAAWRPWAGTSETTTTTATTTTTTNKATTDSGPPSVFTPSPVSTPPISRTQSPGISSVSSVSVSSISATATTTTATATSRPIDTSSKKMTAAARLARERDVLRSPGINQPGAIPGFMEYFAAHQRRGAPSRVRAEGIDHDALREGLQER